MYVSLEALVANIAVILTRESEIVLLYRPDSGFSKLFIYLLFIIYGQRQFINK